MRDTGIFNQEVVNEVKGAMSNHGGGYKPEVFLEAEHGKQ
jgi:hypothetical protein